MSKTFSLRLYLIIVTLFMLACNMVTGTLTLTPPTELPLQPAETPVPPITMIGEGGATLVYVPEGKFMMGAKADDELVKCKKSYDVSCIRELFTNAEPPHTVALDAFWIDQTEVTNKLYAICVDAGECDLPGSKYRIYNTEFANYPVVGVSWDNANAYCLWAEGRLPTEAEWEKAARGTDARSFPWGETIDCNKANYGRSCVGYITQVGSYESGKSPYGAYDMAGNVLEWVNDWYGETYYQSSPSSNPMGPNSGQFRVLRGGAWNYEILPTSTIRFWVGPGYNSVDDAGFRCAKDASS